MSDSLRDQLLGLGFKPAPKPERKGPPPAKGPRAHTHGASAGHPAKREHVRRDGHKPQGKPHGKPSHKAREEMDLAKAYAIRAQKEKDERIEAERQRQLEAQRRREGKLKLAELLKTATLNKPDAEVARHFEYGGKIRRVYVTAEQLVALNAGELGVVQQGGRYHVVSAEHARQADEVLPGVLALLVDPNAPKEEEAYSDPQYQVPDDLVW